MTEKHLSTQFDAELSGISTRVLEMGGLVESQVAQAVYALSNFSGETATQVLQTEERVNAMEVEIDRDLSSIIWQLASSGVEIGSNVIYARAHNEGATIVPKNAAALMFSMGGQTFMVKSVTIPRRQFLGFSSEDQVRIKEIIEDHFLDAIENNTPSK